MGKGIGNGYPVSATVISNRVAERLAGSGFTYAQSHQNDPLGAAIALEVIRIIEAENLIERGEKVGAVLCDGLEGIRSRTGRITDVRARGLMAAVDLEDGGDDEYAARVQRALVQRGFVLARRPSLSTLRLDPALTIAKEDIDRFLSVLETILNGQCDLLDRSE